MNVTVPTREQLRLSRVDGNLHVHDGGIVEVDGKDLVVTGIVICYGDADKGFSQGRGF